VALISLNFSATGPAGEEAPAAVLVALELGAMSLGAVNLWRATRIAAFCTKIGGSRMERPRSLAATWPSAGFLVVASSAIAAPSVAPRGAITPKGPTEHLCRRRWRWRRCAAGAGGGDPKIFGKRAGRVGQPKQDFWPRALNPRGDLFGARGALEAGRVVSKERTGYDRPRQRERRAKTFSSPVEADEPPSSHIRR